MTSFRALAALAAAAVSPSLVTVEGNGWDPALSLRIVAGPLICCRSSSASGPINDGVPLRTLATEMVVSAERGSSSIYSAIELLEELLIRYSVASDEVNAGTTYAVESSLSGGRKRNTRVRHEVERGVGGRGGGGDSTSIYFDLS